MSRFTYAGPYRNPTEGWFVKENAEGKYEIWLRCDREPDGSAPPDRKHKGAPTFDEAGDADEYIAECAQESEDDYDQYLDENRYEINQMERLEAFLNER